MTGQIPAQRRPAGRPLARRQVLGGVLATSALTLAGCSSRDDGEIVVGIVSNPQMQDAISLKSDFERRHPDVKVKFVALPENEARAKITASVATGGGEFDVVMISNYETPIWAANGWIENLQPYAERTPGYQPQDFIGSVRSALSYKGDLHPVPFYGESSFLVWNKDLFAKKGLEMPERPTWTQVRDLAAQLNDPSKDISGIALRGLAGWGEIMAPLTTVFNTFGGGWFDEQWKPLLTSEATRRAAHLYVDLVRKHGQPGAATSGYGDCLTRYAQGQAAMWYDATAMVSSVEDPASSKVAGRSGYAPAPVEKTQSSGWLYSWSLAIPTTSKRKDAAWQFIAWMTDPAYMRLVGQRLGWERVPPGSRSSTYRLPGYAKVSKAYAQPTLAAMGSASQKTSMTRDVPYSGLQFVAIPEFQDLGTRVGQQLSAAVAGQKSMDDALEQSQEYAEAVSESYRSKGS